MFEKETNIYTYKEERKGSKIFPWKLIEVIIEICLFEGKGEVVSLFSFIYFETFVDFSYLLFPPPPGYVRSNYKNDYIPNELYFCVAWKSDERKRKKDGKRRAYLRSLLTYTPRDIIRTLFISIVYILFKIKRLKDWENDRLFYDN